MRLGVGGHWGPAVQGDRNYDSRFPTDGELIAFNRKPFRVVEVKRQERVDWTPEAAEQMGGYYGATEQMTERFAPRYVILQPVPSGKRVHLLIQPWHSAWWEALPEHYAVCVVCGELAPCTEYTAEKQAQREMKRFDFLSSVMPGCCWSCGEPITERQAVFETQGDNLLLPGGHPARFHARRKCQSGVVAYRRLESEAAERSEAL